MNWYNMDLVKMQQTYKFDVEQGLSSKEVKKLRQKYGRNELVSERGPSLLSRFFAQFRDFMIITLLAAALISFVASYLQGELNFTDPLIILAIVIINALLGIYQESKAEHSLAMLQKLQTPETIVIRDGKRQKIPSQDLVSGDIVHLETGCLIPATGW